MKTIPVVAALIRKEGKILIARRKPEKSQAGLWELPGGKLEEEESPQEALKRELKEELGVEVVVGAPFMSLEHAYETFTIHLMVFWADSATVPVASTDHDELVWIGPEEWRKYPFAPADIPVMEELCARFGQCGIHDFSGDSVTQ